MSIVTVRDLVIGEGKPKICIPITAFSKEEILSEAEHIRKTRLADLVEWRTDFYEELFDEAGKIDEASLLGTLKELNEALGKVPLLFTFRTAAEGGNRELKNLYYENLLDLAASSGYADMIDVEVMRDEAMSKRIIKKVHSYKLTVIASNHDFEKTPSREEMLETLKYMQQLGADIAKLAVMPQNRDDVIRLLVATYEMNRNSGRTPVVTMSMGKEGSISRLIGEFTGSAITFGCLQAKSAPGQIDVFKLQAVLQIIHDNMN